MSAPLDGSYLAPSQREELASDIAQGFARLITHGNGGSFRLTRAAQIEMGSFTLTRTRDEATGDLIFTVAEAAQ